MIFNNSQSAIRNPQIVKGFTIVELLVVIGIIGIVTSIVMASINSAKAKGRDAKRIADISVIQLSLERYYDQYHYYPFSPLASDSNFTAYGPIPTDPKTGSPYSYSALNVSNSAVCSSGSCQSYHLGATLELANGILDDDSMGADNTDNAVGFAGSDTAGCGGGSGKCYDVLPKF